MGKLINRHKNFFNRMMVTLNKLKAKEKDFPMAWILNSKVLSLRQFYRMNFSVSDFEFELYEEGNKVIVGAPISAFRIEPLTVSDRYRATTVTDEVENEMEQIVSSMDKARLNKRATRLTDRKDMVPIIVWDFKNSTCTIPTSSRLLKFSMDIPKDGESLKNIVTLDDASLYEPYLKVRSTARIIVSFLELNIPYLGVDWTSLS